MLNHTKMVNLQHVSGYAGPLQAITAIVEAVFLMVAYGVVAMLFLMVVVALYECLSVDTKAKKLNKRIRRNKKH